MEKSDAVATLGEQAPALASLLRPAQVRAALKANDRLELYLSVLQAAHAHAQQPVLMAQAMQHAVLAGRMAYLAGRMPKKLYASASSPLGGLIG